LRAEHNSLERLRRAQASLATLAPIADHVRRELADRHADQLTLAELDGELERKALVNVAGGGGGSGYVYIGAYLRLHEAGIRPAFVVGASMGAVIGLFDARAAVPPWDQYLVVAHTLAARELFAPPTRHRRYGLPGLIRLHLATTFGSMFTGEDGEPMRIRDVEVPYEAVVAGVRRRSYERLPQRFRRAPGAGRNRLALASAVAARMWQVALFFDPRVVKPVLLGADAQTVGLRAYDAAGFAAAIPGVLHYDVLEPDPETELALDGLFEREELAALVDGGVTANVPAALAWNRVRDGKLGTRNAFTLAFDSFHPQWDPRHLWLQPITQAIALQQARDARYADWTIRFEPTLSPVTLVPSPETVDHAIEWGRNSVDPLIPMLQRSLEPVWWDAPSPGG
jgi:hypothetical protein